MSPPLFDNFPQDSVSIKKKKKIRMYNAGCADSSAVRITPFLVMLTISFPCKEQRTTPVVLLRVGREIAAPPRDFRTLERLSHSARLSPRGRRRRGEFSEVPAKIRPAVPRRRQLRQEDATHELLLPSPPARSAAVASTPTLLLFACMRPSSLSPVIAFALPQPPPSTTTAVNNRRLRDA